MALTVLSVAYEHAQSKVRTHILRMRTHIEQYEDTYTATYEDR
jgi:hypothetical protein